MDRGLLLLHHVTYQLIRSEAPSGLYIGTYEKKFYQDSGFTFLITRNNFWYYKSRNVAEFLEQEGLEHRVFFHNPIYTQQEGSNIQCEGDIFVPNKGIGRFYLLQFIPNQISYQAVYLIYCCFEPENYDTAKEEFEKVSRLIYRASRGQILYP
ncbi:hypothetical protein DB43_FY00010 [Parachlamydia acanthamoebae]|uniref:Uncharacterized protein n=1 Tax=Parachlamydia acanthamoebae TaxID=83552 RepID=A0A0C1C9J3_9BACT|nr:hypothetical protein DB43_FY00010 [Parachlamydia acanthamoebae]